MQVICEATLDNELQRETLCEAIKKLGGTPLAVKSTVYLEYEGEKPQVEEFIKLFEQYNRHGICTTNF